MAVGIGSTGIQGLRGEVPSVTGGGGISSLTIGTTPITSGTNKRVLFDDNGVVGEDAGLTYDKSVAALTVGGATVTASNPVLSLTQTWNDASTVFTGQFANYTATNFSGSAGANIFDYQIGGVSALKCSIVNSSLAGNANVLLFLGAGLGGTGYLDNDPFIAGYNVGGNHGIIFGSDQINSFVASGNGGPSGPILAIRSNGCLGFNGVSGFSSLSPDTMLFRDAAGVLALQNSSNAQTFRVYGTFTNSSNYERFTLDAEAGTSNTNRLRAEAAGTGTTRIIAIDGFTKAGAAANTDLPSGTWALIHDSSGATTKLCYNDGGTLRTVALT